jgi:hypothetical protein
MNTRYFFDVDNGLGLYADTAGIDLADARAARVEAIAILRELARDELAGSGDHRFVATARDEAGHSFFRATLTVKGEWLGN